ncbi:hypothetical protein P7C70_g2550, partial [Phenoliferia sp. Uapishka_3]
MGCAASSDGGATAEQKARNAQIEEELKRSKVEMRAGCVIARAGDVRRLGLIIKDAIGALWADPSTRAVVDQSMSFQLNDSASYFFDAISRIGEPKYIPTDQDILRTRVRSTGITEERFRVKGHVLRVFDVGGQRSERKKWIHCFENVQVLVFVAAISEIGQQLWEDETISRMDEATMLFESISSSRWFEKSAFVLLDDGKLRGSSSQCSSIHSEFGEPRRRLLQMGQVSRRRPISCGIASGQATWATATNGFAQRETSLSPSLPAHSSAVPDLRVWACGKIFWRQKLIATSLEKRRLPSTFLRGLPFERWLRLWTTTSKVLLLRLRLPPPSHQHPSGESAFSIPSRRQTGTNAENNTKSHLTENLGAYAIRLEALNIHPAYSPSAFDSTVDFESFEDTSTPLETPFPSANNSTAALVPQVATFARDNTKRTFSNTSRNPYFQQQALQPPIAPRLNPRYTPSSTAEMPSRSGTPAAGHLLPVAFPPPSSLPGNTPSRSYLPPSSQWNSSRSSVANSESFEEKTPYSQTPSPALQANPTFLAKEKSSNFGTTPPHPQNSKTSSTSRRRRWIIATCLLLLLAVGGGVGAGVALSHKETNVVVDDGSLSGATSSVAVVAEPSLATAATKAVAKASGSRTASAFASVATASASSTARRIVVIGASYCDNGHARATTYSSSLEPAPYFGGRHSNGIVWDEYLAQYISVGGANNTDMRNYAYSGAMVDNTITSANVPDTKAQFASYIADVESGLVPALPAGGRTLIAVWAGLNPVMVTWTSAVTSRTSTTPISVSAITNAQAQVTRTAQALISQINSLRSKNFAADYLILPLPPTELLPYAVSASQGIPAWLDLFKTLTKTYNSVLLAGVAAMANTSTSSVLTYDIPTLYTNLVANPSADGLSNVVGACVVGMTACSTPSSHLWWDSIHMTTTVHQFVAMALAPAIKTLWKQ